MNSNSQESNRGEQNGHRQCREKSRKEYVMEWVVMLEPNPHELPKRAGDPLQIPLVRAVHPHYRKFRRVIRMIGKDQLLKIAHAAIAGLENDQDFAGSFDLSLPPIMRLNFWNDVR